MIEAHREQFTVNVILVGTEWRTPFPDPLPHRTQRVEDRQGQQQYRDRRADFTGRALRRADAEHANRKGQQLTAGIAHEEACRAGWRQLFLPPLATFILAGLEPSSLATAVPSPPSKSSKRLAGGSSHIRRHSTQCCKRHVPYAAPPTPSPSGM
jgi:hypothetical protein